MKKYVWKRMWARKYAPYISSSFMLTFRKHAGLNLGKNKLFVPEGNLYAIYFEELELNKMIANYEKTLSKANLPSYAQKYEKQLKSFYLWSKKVAETDFTTCSNSQLAGVLTQAEQRRIEFSELQFYAFLVLEGPGRKLETLLADKPQVLQAISTPYQYTQITTARIELLKIAQRKKINLEALKTYAKKYSWLSVYEYIDKPLTVDDFKSQLSAIKNPTKELENILGHHKQGLKAYKKYISSEKNRTTKKLAEIVHYFSYLKEMRDDYRRHAYYLWQPFWQEIAKRLGMDFELTNYLLEHELKESLTKHKNFSVIAKERQEKYALWYKEGKLSIYSGKKANMVAAQVTTSYDTKEIKGSCASMGKVIGRVNIIYHQAEFKKFKPGDILVTTMTHPEFLMIMKQSKAIVTDEGGITCHAAIVSRELGKPCVIGTKHATKILKDGDIIEVDANNGIVKKL